MPYARTYRLEQGADGRWSTFDANGNRFTAKGQYNFATIDGEIRVSPMRNGHYSISGGADAVDYAGSVQFGRGTTRGQLVQFSNDSGRFLDQLGLHLGKADIVPIDYRFLTPQNQRVLMDIVGRQSAANQSRVIIIRR